MGVKDTVFGSRAERANYQKLQSRWGDLYDLWHNIPFLNIFTSVPSRVICGSFPEMVACAA